MAHLESSSSSSLFAQLGGEGAVDAAVDIFYRKVLADERLAPFFANVDMDRQIKKQKAFLTMAFGGPTPYTGKSLRAVHARLVRDEGLNDTHFDAVAGHLQSALEELAVPAPLVAQVLAIAGSTRNDVLDR